MARAIATKTADGKLTWRRVGDWVPYNPDQVRIAQDTTFAYDEYETTDPTGVNATPGDNPTYTGCGTAGSRYSFGPGYWPGYRYNDIHVVAGAKGKTSTRTFFAWIQDLNAATDFQYATFTTENFPLTAAGANDPSAAGRGDYPGVVASFGPVPPGNGYYYADVDLTGLGFGFQLPTDGDGGCLTLSGDVDANNNITIVGQSMLWGVNPGNPTPPCSDQQWDDDVTVDLLFTQDELYSYTYGLCPDPLGVMQAFLYTPGPTNEVLSPVSETIVFGKGTLGNLASYAADDANARRICKFIVPNLFVPFCRVNLNFTTTKTTPTLINFVTKAKMFQAGAFKIRLFIQNKVSSVFDQILVDSTINTVYNTYTGVATGTLTNYVGAAGAMTGRIEVQQTGPAATILPCSDFEYANMSVTG